jgi:hypothetical protein
MLLRVFGWLALPGATALTCRAPELCPWPLTCSFLKRTADPPATSKPRVYARYTTSLPCPTLTRLLSFADHSDLGTKLR